MNCSPLLISIFGIVSAFAADHQYECGKNEKVKRPYGWVELEIDCGSRRNNIFSRAEYKTGKQHGFQIGYDTLWRKKDSSFFVNGKKEGNVLFWDTLGNVISRSTYRLGVQFGKDENYWSPGHPSVIMYYNAKGEENGPCDKWWPNGTKRSEGKYKDGQLLTLKEYYPNGAARMQFTGKYERKQPATLKDKHVQGETWGPNGKSAGKIVDGNGSWIRFPDGSDSTNTKVFREVYKDSVLLDIQPLNAAEIEKWQKP